MLLTFKKRYAVLDIKEPRYHDRVVLLATHKIQERNRINILQGAYKGTYFISGVVATAYPIQSNGKINCYAVPLSQLERLEDGIHI